MTNGAQSFRSVITDGNPSFHFQSNERVQPLNKLGCPASVPDATEVYGVVDGRQFTARLAAGAGALCLTDDTGQARYSPSEQAKNLSLDSNWRCTHKAGEPTNCYTDSEWDASICLDGETCAGHCAVGAVTQHNWAETYGVGQNGTGVDVGFVTQLVLLWTVRSGLEVGEWQGQQ